MPLLLNTIATAVNTILLVLLLFNRHDTSLLQDFLLNVRFVRIKKMHENMRNLSKYTLTSTKATVNPEGSACNSCNSWPLYTG